jgi:hypothetical protein
MFAWVKCHLTVAFAYFLRFLNFPIEGAQAQLLASTFLDIAQTFDSAFAFTFVLADSLFVHITRLRDSLSGVDENLGEPPSGYIGRTVYFGILVHGQAGRTALAKSLAVLIANIQRGNEYSPMLSIISEYVLKSQDDGTLATFLDLLPSFLRSAWDNLTKYSDRDVASLDSILSICHGAAPEAVIEAITPIFASDTFSGTVLKSVLTFLDAKELDIARLVPSSYENAVKYARLLLDAAHIYFTTPALLFILRLLNATLPVVLATLGSRVIRPDEDLLQLITLGTCGPASLCYHKIERLCYLAFHVSDPAVRTLSYDVLSLLGQVSSARTMIGLTTNLASKRLPAS